MKCEICNKKKEFYGKMFQIRSGIKYQDKFYICMNHVPYSEFSIVTSKEGSK